MSKPTGQRFRYPLPTQTWATGGPISIDPSTIPAKLPNGKLAHIERIDFICAVTPTVSSGTLTAEALQALVPKLTIRDGARLHFQADTAAFLQLRAFEALERGYLTGEPDAAATTEQVVFKRTWRPGPYGFRQSPGDFLLPPGSFKGGEISGTWGLLADFANATAFAATMSVVVHLIGLDELRIGSLYERAGYAANNEAIFAAGKGLLAFLGMCDARTLVAITAGDFANVQVRSTGCQEDPLHVSDLAQMYLEDMDLDGITQVRGEPRSATDDNQKVLSGTAAAAATAAIQPVIWSPPGARISKLMHVTDNGISVKWSGTQAAAYFLVGRFLERDAKSLATYQGLALKALEGKGLAEPRVKTLNRGEFKGPRDRALYMPLTHKLVG